MLGWCGGEDVRVVWRGGDVRVVWRGRCVSGVEGMCEWRGCVSGVEGRDV